MARNIELEKINNNTDNGFRFGMMECRYFPKQLHYHPEIELVYINKGEGLCFVGDAIVQFHPGDLFIFSANISHYFKSAPQFYLPNYPLRCGSTYLQFRESVLPADYMKMPGCANIRNLVTRAELGIRWSSSKINHSILEQIEAMERIGGFDRLLKLYVLLDNLGRTIDDCESLASMENAQARRSGDTAYRSVIEYITHNFHNNITLEKLAEHAGMNRTALCRHFKNRAQRSIFDFLLEFRINFARQQLLSTNLPISEIAVEAGFNNLPNFNVQFKRQSGCTPGEYRVRGIVK